MTRSNDEVFPKDSIRELFGPPPPRRPIPSNSFNALVKIFSFFPDQNPFSDFASFTKLPECPRWCAGNLNNLKRPKAGIVHDDSIVPRGDKQASDNLIGPASVEVHSSSVHNGAIIDPNPGVFCEDDSFSALDMVMDDLYKMTKNSKTMDKMASNEEGSNARIVEIMEVPEALSGIEKILMDESDDVGMSGLPEKDVNFDFLNDFGSILDINIFMNDTVTAESSQSGEPTFDGNMKEDVAGEVRRNDVEVNRSTLGGHVAKYHSHLPVDREISNLEEAVNQHASTCLEYSQSKESKLCKEQATNKLLELEEKCKKGGEKVSIGDVVDIVGKRIKSGIAERVSIGDVVDSVGKRNKPGIATMAKTEKACLEDVKSGKNKHISLDGGSFNSTKFGGANSLTHGKMVDRNACRNIEKSFTRKVKNSQPESSKGFCYTREQLLHLRNMTSVSDDILKVLHEIGAELHDEHSAAVETGLWKADCFDKRKLCSFEGKEAEEEDISGTNKEKQVYPTDDKSAKENQMDSSVLKRKRGSASEARKEKKKRQKRKKRAELNKKVGVRRLKLKPVLKPKVVPHCRHYLLGRCQEGEKCKFSHDVIPLTKSKPCSHFARNACMKGHECPFDHQLSKYPCNNYVSTGFCVRGDSCLFSHKAPTEGSNFVSSISNCDKSKYELQLNGSTSLASGVATANGLKEDSARQTSQPVHAPKGLSFLSFGKCSVKDSAKQKEAELTQQISGDAARTRGLPKITAGSGSKRNDDGTGTGNQLNQEIMNGAVNVCQLLKGALAPISSPKEIDLPASSGPSYVNSSGKLQEAAAMPTKGHTNSGIAEKETVNDSDISKTRQDFCTSSGQFPTDGVRSTSITAPKALLSALSFAAKYESGIKTTSMTPSKDLNKNGGTKTDSKCRQKEESKASAILEFLYSGGNQKR